MNNAEKFQEVFGYYATEMWAKPESEFLEWINSEYVPTIEVMTYPQVDGITPTLVTPEVSKGVIGQGSGDIDWQAVTSTGQEIYAKGYEDGRKSSEASKENELKFYYVDSIDEYWIGQRHDNFYYAKWNSKLGFVWSVSRYLPWGEHVVDEQTLWKEHTYPSEPREIPFTEWIVGFMKKHTSEDAISREWLLSNIEQGEKEAGGIIDTDTDNVKNFIRVAPSVVPNVTEGKWLTKTVKKLCPPDCWYPGIFAIEGSWNEEEGSWLEEQDGFCSNCGKQDEHYGVHKYCSNCGAKMKGAE